MLLYSRDKYVSMTEAQRKCYNTINENDKILILKKRQAGATTLLATCVINELKEGYNKTICYMSPSSSMNREFMSIVSNSFIEDMNNIVSNTIKKLELLNGNKLITMRNCSENFCGLQKIDMFIYDEIGFERGDFPALYKTLALYRPLKRIFTYTTADCGNILTPCLEIVQDWLLMTSSKRVLLPMFSDVRIVKDDIYDRIQKLYS